MKKIIFIFINFCFIVQCLAITLSPEDTAILDCFFRTLMEKSEGGYILFNQKPICINGFLEIDSFTYENENHKNRTYLRQGAFLWKKLFFQENKRSNFYIHIYDKVDSLASDYMHILFINKKLTLDTIRENLSLFQYILGPEVTPENLLNELMDPDKSWHTTLRDNKVLIGILLGFGTQNSIYVSRAEFIQENNLGLENPPFLNTMSELDTSLNVYKDALLFDYHIGTKSDLFPVIPSFSFSTIENELEALSRKIDVCSIKLAQNDPPYIFGKIKSDSKCEQKIRELEKTQLKILKFVRDPNFLRNTLKLLLPNEKLIIEKSTKEPLKYIQSEAVHLFEIVAANIWSNLEEEHEEYFQGFLQGMKDSDANLQNPTTKDCTNYRKFKKLVEINEKLKQTDDFFLEFEKDKDQICILPQKLYYKTIKSSNEERSIDYTKATFHYAIKDSEGNLLVDTFFSRQPVELDLHKTIPGFSHGVKGMKKGEVREIFIHPSLAYGVYTSLEKGAYFIARVELVDFSNNLDQMTGFPTLKLIDLNKELAQVDDKEFSQVARSTGYLDGFLIWEHYKKEKAYTIDRVLNVINRLKTNEFTLDLSPQSNQDLLNKLHWNIYNRY